MLLQEARYYGKCKELLEIEECAEIIRERCLKNPLYSPTNSKETKKIEELFCKLFNFERFDLQWEVSPIENSWTYPQTTVIFPLTKEEAKIKQTGKGIQFVNSKGRIALVTTFTALFTMTKLTGAEWVSIILHEIGHNFYNTTQDRILRPILLNISIAYDLLLALTKITDNPKLAAELLVGIANALLVITRTGRKVTVQLKDLDNKYLNGFLQKLKSYSNAIYDIAISLVNQVIYLAFLPLVAINMTMKIVPTTISGVIKLWITDGYNNEKFADNFTTMYGYGSETAEVERKFTYTNINGVVGKGVSKVPVIGHYYVTLSAYVMAVASLGDAHPLAQTRIKEQKRYLEQVLVERKVNAKQRKEIMNQIEEIDKTYENFFKVAKGEGSYAIAIFFKKLFRSMGLDEDFKEAFFANHDNYNWDKAITNNLEESVCLITDEFIIEGDEY